MSRSFSIKQAANELERSEKTIRRWIHSGELKAARIGGQYQISTEAINGMVVPVDPAQANEEPHQSNDANFVNYMIHEWHNERPANLQPLEWVHLINSCGDIIAHAGHIGIDRVAGVQKQELLKRPTKSCLHLPYADDCIRAVKQDFNAFMRTGTWNMSSKRPALAHAETLQRTPHARGNGFQYVSAFNDHHVSQRMLRVITDAGPCLLQWQFIRQLSGNLTETGHRHPAPASDLPDSHSEASCPA